MRKEDWIRVEDDMPKDRVKVAACYVNQYGKRRYVMAEHISRLSVLVSDYMDEEAEYTGEYNEEADDFYMLEGWYERVENWDYSGCEIVEGEVTHYIPIVGPEGSET